MSHQAAAVDRPAEPSLSIVSASAAPLTVEIKRSLDLEPKDVATLETLIAGRPDVGVFLSRAWLSGFFAEPPTGFDPSLAMLREQGVLRGIVPIAVRHTLGRVRVQLLGGGIGSDRVDLLAARGFEAACSDRFLSWLGEAFDDKAFVLELRDVPADSPLWGAVRRASDERKWRVALQPREIHTLPYLSLDSSPAAPGGGQVFPVHPRSLDKHRRWLERRGRLRVEILENLQDVFDAFESLTGFLQARWRDSEGGSALERPRALRFHRHALPLLLREGRLRMVRFSADDRTIAVFYGVAGGASGAIVAPGTPRGARGAAGRASRCRWWGYYLAGYDREWAGRIHLGQITLATAIDLAQEEGAAEFDFLKGAERVKYLWPVRERTTLDAEVYSEKSWAQLERAAWAIREAAAAFAKSARDLFSTHTHHS